MTQQIHFLWRNGCDPVASFFNAETIVIYWVPFYWQNGGDPVNSFLMPKRRWPSGFIFCWYRNRTHDLLGSILDVGGSFRVRVYLANLPIHPARSILLKGKCYFIHFKRKDRLHKLSLALPYLKTKIGDIIIVNFSYSFLRHELQYPMSDWENGSKYDLRGLSITPLWPDKMSATKTRSYGKQTVANFPEWGEVWSFPR